MQDLMKRGGRRTAREARLGRSCFALVYVGTARGGLSKRGLSRRDLDLGPTSSPITVLWYTIRLWYDILVFVAVLSFHSARYRSGYGPRRPLEARSRPRLPRPNSHRSPCSLPFGTIRLWYDITVFAAVLSFHSARYRSCDVKTACMLSYICEIPAIYTTS